MQAKFGSNDFDQIEGYRISLALDPTQGFQGNFCVYLFDRIEAPDKPDGPLNLETETAGSRPRARLTIGGVHRQYRFDDIELVRFEAGADRQSRYRFMEFRYPSQLTDRKKAPVLLENDDPQEPNLNSLGQDYMYSIDDADAEHLLGFSNYQRPDGEAIIRFSCCRNGRNSFVEKLIAANEGRRESGALPPFKVKFSQYTFDVTSKNLARALAEESFGECLSWPTPSLSEVAGPRKPGDLCRVEFPSSTALDLAMVDAGKMQSRNDRGFPATVEVATFCFQQGAHRMPPII
jgi:hypothetical protein